MERHLLATGTMLLAFAAGCSLGLEGAPCPCAEGWVCCEGRQICLKDRAECAACGDDRCEGEETCTSCPRDCGPCGLIPADRRIDWDPGIPGGVPPRSTICASAKDPPYGAKGDGKTDDTAAIQAALEACPSQQVLILPAGTYRVTDTLVIPRSITLRGEGPGRTIVDARGAQKGAVIHLGRSPAPAGAALDLTGAANKGSTTVTVAALPQIAAGDHLLIDQLNDPTLVSSSGYNGDCTWCSRESGARARGQIVEVTAVDAARAGLTFKPPLYSALDPALKPQAVPLRMAVSWAGVEDLTVRANDTGAGSSFVINRCAYCWLRNVEGDHTDGDHVRVQSSFRCEVRDSYFHDAFHRRPGETHDDISLSAMTTASLVENNVLWRLYVGVKLDYGAAGNVIAYNHASSLFSEEAPDAVGVALSLSGAHPAFNLWEGNVGARLAHEGGFGSTSHGTVFRNWLFGGDTACEPLSGGAPVDKTRCRTLFQQVYAVNLGYSARHYNVLGNVLGSSYFTSTHCFPYYGTTSGCTPIPAGTYMIVAPRDTPSYETPYAFRLGYVGSGSKDNPLESDQAFATLLNHGNWDFVTRSVKWASGLGATGLPVSLYRKSRPAWFGDRPWPPVEPRGNPAAIDPTVIPAGYRFVHGTLPPGTK